jgi:AraC-like DNA-binding protein
MRLVWYSNRWWVSKPRQPILCLQLLAFRRGYRVCEISEELGCTERRLHGTFMRDLGIAPLQWMKLERMVAARRMLAAGLEIEDISERLGFTNKHNFRREFKKHHNVLPSTYQEHRRNPTRPGPVDG